VVFAPVSGGIIRRFGGKTALMTGACVMIAGYVGRVFFHDSITVVVIGSTVVSVGTAIAYAAMPTLIMGAVPITETASANGLNSLVRSIGTSTSSAAVAAVLTSVTMTLGPVRAPSFAAFQDVFWMAALASAASVLAAIAIPRAAAHRPAVPAPAAAELVVQGRVLAADHRPLTPAVVTVLQVTGEPVDWSRVDTEGNYSVALPGAGKYLMVANAAGWAPMAEVFEFDGRTLRQNFLLQDRLELGGTATLGGEPVARAVVTLLQASGEHVATTRTDDDGAYRLPLPAAGRYIVTMLHPVNHQAMARKLAVDNRSATVDLAAPLVEEQNAGEPVNV
jgi:MFS family permease